VLSECLSCWHSGFPTPPYYTPPQQLRPYLWMKLDKFTSDRFHQMRAQKAILPPISHGMTAGYPLAAQGTKTRKKTFIMQFCNALPVLSPEKSSSPISNQLTTSGTPLQTSIKSLYTCGPHLQATLRGGLVGVCVLHLPSSIFFPMRNLFPPQFFSYLVEIFRFPLHFIFSYFS
jgi:hypothetical protein